MKNTLIFREQPLHISNAKYSLLQSQDKKDNNQEEILPKMKHDLVKIVESPWDKFEEIDTNKSMNFHKSFCSPPALPEATITSSPLRNFTLPQLKEESINESMATEQIWKESGEKDFGEVKKAVPMREIPNILIKNVELKKRTYKDCPDCLSFMKLYGEQLPEEVVAKRIKKCRRHNRMEEDINLTPEGFWDPFMLSLPPDDRRKEVFVDYRLVNRENQE